MKHDPWHWSYNWTRTQNLVIVSSAIKSNESSFSSLELACPRTDSQIDRTLTDRQTDAQDEELTNQRTNRKSTLRGPVAASYNYSMNAKFNFLWKDDVLISTFLYTVSFYRNRKTPILEFLSVILSVGSRILPHIFVQQCLWRSVSSATEQRTFFTGGVVIKRNWPLRKVNTELFILQRLEGCGNTCGGAAGNLLFLTI